MIGDRRTLLIKIQKNLFAELNAPYDIFYERDRLEKKYIPFYQHIGREIYQTVL